MADNSPLGGSNGEQIGAQTDRMMEGAEGMREQARRTGQVTGEQLRQRAQEAQEWARSQWSGIQHQVEEDPARATLWALGIGFVAGILLSGIMRGGRS